MAAEYSFFLTETLYSIPEAPVSVSEPAPITQSAEQPTLIAESASKAAPSVPVIPKPEPESVGFGSLGYQLSKSRNCRTILITSVAPELFQEIPQFSFLPKMLKAVGENAAEVCYLNMAPDKADVSELQLIQNYQFALIFLSPQHPFAKRLMLELYQPKNFKGMNTVLANELHLVESDKQNKTSLWGALQSMYLQQ